MTQRVSRKQSSPQSSPETLVRSEADRDTETVRSQAQRPRRNSIGVPRLTLAVQREILGYHLCWMNDDGNVEQALDSGYEFVVKGETELENGVTPSNVDASDKIKQKVGTTQQGDVLYAFLMKIRQEWHEEDMALVEAENKRIEDAIAGGNINGNVGQDGKYVSNISIKRS
jgi:hypothetical protein